MSDFNPDPAAPFTMPPVGEVLKPCPFCGGKPRASANGLARDLIRFRCENCDAGPSASIGQGSAEERWNRRALPQDGAGEKAVGLRAALKKAGEFIKQHDERTWDEADEVLAEINAALTRPAS